MKSFGLKDALYDHSVWATLSLSDVEAMADQLSEVVGPQFRFRWARRYTTGYVIPTFEHLKSGIQFNLLPGGQFRMGLLEQEYEEAIRLPNCRADLLRDLMPSKERSVEPFLMSRLPLLESFARQHVHLVPGLFRPEFGDSADDAIPIYMTRAEVMEIVTRFGFLLPTEMQWEYAIRGGTATLFYFGSVLPDRQTLASKILVTNFDQEILDDVTAANPFGLIGTLTGSWCLESYRETGETVGSRESGPYVIRGGGAIFWPWQNQSEWMMCMSAMRMSSDDFEDHTCAAQVVVPIRS